MDDDVVLSEKDFELMVGQHRPPPKKEKEKIDIELWEYLKKLKADEISTVQGRVFSSFKSINPVYWLSMAREDRDFPNELIQQLFEDLKGFPSFNLNAARSVLKIQKFLRLQIQNKLETQAKEDDDIKELIKNPVVKENLIRSYVYEVMSAARNEYFIIKNIVLRRQELTSLSLLVDHCGSIFTAVNPIFNHSNMESLTEQDVFDAMCQESKEKIWGSHFEPYINVVDPVKNTKKMPGDSDSDLLIQSIEAFLDSSDFKKIGINLSIDMIVKELNKKENRDKKSIVLNACEALIKEKKKYFGKSNAAQILYGKKPWSKFVKSTFDALYDKLSNSDAEESSCIDNSIGVDTEYTSSPDFVETSSDDGYSGKIKDDQESMEDDPTLLIKEKRNKILVDQWKAAWDSKKPKTAFGKFFKLIGPPSAKEEITSKISSPISKLRYEKIDSIIDNIDSQQNYSALYNSTREFMSGWFINSSNLPERNYTLLKQFEMTLDYITFADYIDQHKLEREFEKTSDTNSIASDKKFENSTDTISLSTTKDNDIDMQQEPLTDLLYQISDEVQIFLKQSRKLQNEKEKHTGLKFIARYLTDFPIQNNDIGLFYAQMRAISDQRLSASGLFVDLFKKRMGRDSNAQDFYKLFKTTPLMVYEVSMNKFVPNIKNVQYLLDQLKEMNLLAKRKLEEREGIDRCSEKDLAGLKH